MKSKLSFFKSHKNSATEFVNHKLAKWVDALIFVVLFLLIVTSINAQSFSAFNDGPIPYPMGGTVAPLPRAFFLSNDILPEGDDSQIQFSLDAGCQNVPPGVVEYIGQEVFINGSGLPVGIYTFCYFLEHPTYGHTNVAEVIFYVYDPNPSVDCPNFLKDCNINPLGDFESFSSGAQMEQTLTLGPGQMTNTGFRFENEPGASWDNTLPGEWFRMSK